MTWSVRGRRVVVTGATAGLGRVTAVEVARLGARPVVTTRSRHRAQPVVDQISGLGADVEAVELDLSSLGSVREAIAAISAGGTVDVLVNNAGTALGRGVTVEGFEKTIGVNYVGPFALTAGLLPRMGEDQRPRVVNVSSHAHHRVDEFDFDRMRGKTRSPLGIHEYSLSKLAMVLWGRELARRHPEIDVYTVHPGMVATSMWPQPFRWLLRRRMLTPEQGAQTQIACATDPRLEGVSGRYWWRGRPTAPSTTAQDDRLAKELWEWTEAQLRTI